MSFDKFKEFVENGDLVIVYLGFDRMHTITAKSGDVFQTKYGALKHSDIIGSRYGSRVQCAKGYTYVLHPTPELWTDNLPHRTQILYSTDISMVTMQLDLKPGSVVVESGTGSGSLAHAIIRTIAPTGHLYTFEFHEQRAKVAKKEFEDHHISQYVTVTQKDVCEDGFGLAHIADAVFLDLPKPWEAVESAKQAMKKEGGRLCSFSPCIEQVQRTCEELAKHSFVELKTMECLVRNFDVRTINLPIANLGPSEKGDSNGSEPSEKQAKLGSVNEECVNDSALSDIKEDTEETAEMDIDNQESGADNSDGETTEKMDSDNKGKSTRRDFDLIGKKQDRNFFFKTAAPKQRMPGHTGFLTFATLYPS